MTKANDRSTRATDFVVEAMREARHELGEHTSFGKPINPSDVANLADSLERTVGELRGSIHWASDSPVGWRWAAELSDPPSSLDTVAAIKARDRLRVAHDEASWWNTQRDLDYDTEAR